MEEGKRYEKRGVNCTEPCKGYYDKQNFTIHLCEDLYGIVMISLYISSITYMHINIDHVILKCFDFNLLLYIL